VKLDGKFFNDLGEKISGAKAGGPIDNALTKYISKNSKTLVGYSSERAANSNLEIFDKNSAGGETVAESMGILSNSKIMKSSKKAGSMLRNNFMKNKESDSSPLPDKMSGEQYYT
jgi:hypothetical protein